MHRSPALIPGALLVLALAACGSDSDADSAGTTPASPPAVASSAAADPSAGTAPSIAPDAGDRSASDVAKATAAAVREAGSARYTFSSSAAGQQVTGTGAFTLKDDRFDTVLTVTVPGQEAGTSTIEARIIDRTIYVKLPAEDAPEGKSWLKIAADDDSPLAEGIGPVLEQLTGSSDPSSGLQALESAESFSSEGTETIDGVETTKYVAVIDLTKAAESATGPTKKGYQALVDAGVTQQDYSVWLDGDDLIRKFSTTVGTGAQATTAEGTYTAWGEPVDVEAPPASEIATLAELGGLGGAGTPNS